MNPTVEMIGSILINSLVTGESDKAIALAQALHDFDADLYAGLVYLLKFALKDADKEALKTATKLDDEGVKALETLLVASAEKNGITITF